MEIVATTSLPAVDRPNADRWNAARSRRNQELKQTVQELKVDLEAKNNIMAENDMLHLDVMRRVHDKYGYRSDFFQQ